MSSVNASAPALAWRGVVGQHRVHRARPPSHHRRVGGARVVIARCEGGAARAIDPRLDAVVDSLPIREVLYRCIDALETSTGLVLQAPPGAGKTTALPLAMILSNPAWLPRNGKVIVLEPRRLAARAAATRMASILNEPVGKTVGYSVRFESKVSASTRVEVVTEGVLVRRLQRDPSLEGVAAIVFDEFHERSLDADVALALASETRSVLRPDLRLVVMSATLGDVGPRAAAMLSVNNQDNNQDAASSSSSAPLLVSEGKSFPVDTIYLGPPGRNFGDLENATVSAVRRALADAPGVEGGDVLCFLPGAGEINRVVTALRDGAASSQDGTLSVLPLYGALSQAEQQAALAPPPTGVRRVVVSTPIAESSLTIPGVRIVVDAGLARRPLFDSNKGMTRLDTVRISVASADQRRGRAGRVAPGTCYRLWSERAHLQLASDAEPEIANADLAPLALDLATWGIHDDEGVDALPWLDRPPAGRLAAARDLLARLGATDEITGRVTPLGTRMAQLPLHPRLARMVLWGACRGPESCRMACQIAAVVSDRDLLRGRDAPADVRARLGALWSVGEAGADGPGRWSLAADATSAQPTPSPPSSPTDQPPNPAAPVRVPIGTKLPKGRNKKFKGAPRGRKPAGGGVQAAAKAARAGASSVSSGVSGSSSSGGIGGFGAAYGGYRGYEVDRNAAREAGKVASQLLNAVKRAAAEDPKNGDWCAPGVGGGDPGGPCWDFLLGEGENEAGVLLAMAYPDRVGVRRSKGGNFTLSGGVGAASVPGSDPLAREEVLAVAEMTSGDVGGGARNDRVRLAAPVPMTALEPDTGCLADALCRRRDSLSWASASKAVVARRQLCVGDAVLREAPFQPEPDDTVDAMLYGVKEMGVKAALGWSAKTESWRRRVIWLRTVGGADHLPDLSDVALEASLADWLAPMLPGVTSKSAMHKQLDGDGLVRCLLTYEQTMEVDASCPTHVKVPSGSNLPLDYDTPGGTPVLRARLQELFGMGETPTIGPKRVPIEVHLLSPASRPVQVTTDLASFWKNTYFDVAKELKGRYPKHYWPDDPTTAEATNRAKPRKK